MKTLLMILALAANLFRVSHAATVDPCTEASLRAAAADGGPVTFGCDGTIVLADTLVVSTPTRFEADGHQVTLSGNRARRVIEVSSDIDVTFRGLRIVEGNAPAGAGILNLGRLTIEQCIISGNTSLGTNGARGPNGANAPPRPPGPAANGESGFPGENGGPALGGALLNYGSCVIVGTSITDNQAIGGNGGNGGNAGLPNYTGFSVTLGGQGGAGGDAFGAGIFNGGLLVVSNSCLAGNRAVAGNGGSGGANHGLGHVPGGAGGTASGGGIASTGAVTLVNVTISGNSVVGGNAGGDIMALTVSGGNGRGGGLYLGSAQLNHCTIAFNRSTGGSGISSGLGSPDSSTNGIGLGGNLYSTGAGPTLKNTLLSHVEPHVNSYGPFVDAGNNLSSDFSCSFTTASSQAGLSPQLMPLASNASRAPTHALRPSSPAIDAGNDTDSPSVDQRGEPRPALGASDIGAYELQPTTYGFRSILVVAPHRYLLRGYGVPNSAFRILGSTPSPDPDWTTVASGQVGGNGLLEVEIPGDQHSFRLLRIAAP